MGIPFEALLPYGLMIGVRSSTHPTHRPIRPCPLSLPLAWYLTDILIDVLCDWCRTCYIKEYTKHGQATEILYGSMGQTEYADPSLTSAPSNLSKSMHFTACCPMRTDGVAIVMERDRRLTGYLRGQTDEPDAPPGFELNNPWKVRLSSSWLLDNGQGPC